MASNRLCARQMGDLARLYAVIKVQDKGVQRGLKILITDLLHEYDAGWRRPRRKGDGRRPPKK